MLGAYKEDCSQVNTQEVQQLELRSYREFSRYGIHPPPPGVPVGGLEETLHEENRLIGRRLEDDLKTIGRRLKDDWKTNGRHLEDNWKTT